MLQRQRPRLRNPSNLERWVRATCLCVTVSRFVTLADNIGRDVVEKRVDNLFQGAKKSKNLFGEGALLVDPLLI